jgi:phage I-like protein
VKAPLFANCPLRSLAMSGQEIGARATVQRDDDGLPVAWRLFGIGPLSITQGGAVYTGEFTAEHGRTMMEHARRKKARVPVDSEHFLKSLADEIGVEEQDAAAVFAGKAAAMGFGDLALRDDGLWIEKVEWVPLARRVLQQGVLRYFSPVVRGLVDGRLRVTSVALTNTPALDGLDELVAKGEDDDNGGSAPTATGRPPAREGVETVNKELLAQLAALLSLDAVALSDDGSAPAAIIEKMQALAAEIAALRAAVAEKTAFVAGVKDTLALADGDGLAVLQGKVLALAAQAKDAVALSERVQALERTAAEKARAELITRGLAEGRLTQALVDGWAQSQDAAVLTAYLASAPVIVPVGRTVRDGDLPKAATAALSEMEVKVCRAAGLSAKQIDEITAARGTAR